MQLWEGGSELEDCRLAAEVPGYDGDGDVDTSCLSIFYMATIVC